MLKFMLLMKLTPEGAKLLKEWPEIFNNTNNIYAHLGMKVTELYAGGAIYDFIGIGEMADAQTAELFRRYAISGGFMDAYVVPLYEMEEFNKLAAAIL